MAAEQRTLPLFPLNTVLFPTGTLPLQIFEDRYKQLLHDCLNGDSKFGVVLIKAGQEVGEPAIPFNVGTVVQITQASEIRGGRYFVLTEGQQRFRIENITQYRPYMSAQVELIDDEPNSAVPDSQLEAIRKALTDYFSLTRGLSGGWSRQPRMPSDAAALSWFIGGLLQIRHAEKQALLEEQSTTRRLETELDLLIRELEPLKQRVAEELRKKFSSQ